MPIPGCGASAGGSSSVRMIPSSRRISASAWRPVSSTVISASRSRSCSGLSSRRTALAWTVMTLTECASTSWSSRVIRFRSSSTARRATSSASSIRCSARRARSEWRAVAAERTNVPTTGMLSQISSVAGTSGARMKTVQPATSSAPSAISAWRGSSSEPAAQAARIRTRNIVSVSYAAVGSSSVKARAPEATASGTRNGAPRRKSSAPAVKSAIAETRMRFSSTFIQMSLCVRTTTASASTSKA